MKKAIPVRMPDWPEGELPSTKQVGVYFLFWEHQRKQLAQIPVSDFCRSHIGWIPKIWKSMPAKLNAYAPGRPDRALFIRRLVATYHKRRTSRPMPIATPATPRPTPQTISTGLAATVRQVLERAAAQATIPQRDLSPTQVNEISRARGSWNLLATGKCLPHRADCERKMLLETNGCTGQGIDEVWFLVKR